MNYIINPWVFYLLNVLDNVVGWSIGLITALSAAYVVYILVWCLAFYEDDKEKYPFTAYFIEKVENSADSLHYGINSDSVTRDLLQNAYRFSGDYGTYRRRKGDH